MNASKNKSLLVGLIAGASLTACAAVLMGQGASQPVKSATEYYVTGEGDEAHLWVREGTALRCVGHGECAAHAGHDHKGEDGHDHDKKAPKK